MTSVFHLCLVVGYICVAIAAPVIEDEPQVIRVKRADESLLYGNHQNNARAKKAYDSMLNGGVNPEPILLPENEDKQAEVEVKTEVAKDMAEASPDVNDQLPNTDLTANDDDDLEALKIPAAEAIPEDLETVADDLTIPEALPELTPEAIPEVPADQIEDELEPQPEETETVQDPTDEEMEDLNREEVLNTDNDQEALPEYGAPFADRTSYDDAEDYFYPQLDVPMRVFDDSQYYDPEHGYPVQQDSSESDHKSRNQRSTASKSITAEDMVMGSELTDDKNGRVKRDLGLTPEEVRALLAEDEYGYYPEYNEAEGYRQGYGQGYGQDNVQELLDNVKRAYSDMDDSDSYPYLVNPYVGSDDEIDDDDEYDSLRAELESEQDDDEQTREQLYRYFNGEDADESNLDNEGYYINDEDSLQQYPEHYLEEDPYQDFGDEIQSPRDLLDLYSEQTGSEPAQLINYRGQEGYFIPLSSPNKRSYMSFMPPSKRFYPVDESPEQSRWSALVAGAKERRSEQAMSERLYRLARALNGQEEYDNELDYYKKK